MEPELTKLLSEETVPDNLVRLRDDICSWHKHSRAQMAERHKQWDKNQKVYTGEMAPNSADLEARANSEPERLVVPLTFTQVQTVTTFGYLQMTGKKNFYELEPIGNEDFTIRDCSELTLSRDLAKNVWSTTLYQTLLDASRFGLCCIKSYWEKQTQWVQVNVTPETVTANGKSSVVGVAGPQNREVTKFEGNCIRAIDPYYLLPDLRVPLTRWREGRFMADEMEVHIQQLLELQRKGDAAGVEFIKPFEKTIYDKSERSRFKSVEKFFDSKGDKQDFMCCRTEGQYRLIPADYDLGPETYPVDYFIRIVNDQRIISIERANYLHGEFVYDIGQFSPDNQAKLNLALSDTIYALQDIVTWLVNSRMSSIRKSLDGKVVVDERVIDVSSISRRDYIKTRKNVAVQDIRQAITQLDFKDVTASNFEDADTLMKIVQMVTGVNENAMGQYAPGRRSAAENRAANSGAAARMKMVMSLLWNECYGPLGQKLLINQRQNMSIETFAKILGPEKAAEAPGLYLQFHPADPTQLVGSEDFFVFDGTIASEKIYTAQALQDMLDSLMSIPGLAQAMGINPVAVFEEILVLRGDPNASRFRTPPQAMGPGVPPQSEGATGGAVAQPALPASVLPNMAANGPGGGAGY